MDADYRTSQKHIFAVGDVIGFPSLASVSMEQGRLAEGRLKLLFHRQTLDLLGVHIFGEDAAELLHIGQAVLLLKGKITYFIQTVFNYPTLAECYKAAAFNGLNRLG